MIYKIEPWAHQLDAIEKSLSLPHYALFMDMGTGKTATTINILRHKYLLNGGLLRTVILCPPVVIQNWKREILAHSQIDTCNIVCLSGSGKKRVEQFASRCLYGGAKIVITNYEALLMKDLYSLMKNWPPECLVLDESHKCKDIKAKRTKRAVELGDLSRYKYLLSGTPILNTPMDVFSQFRIMDGGESFGSNYYAFRARYFYDANSKMPKNRYFPNWKVKASALEEINQKIFEKGIRVTKAECLDLPPLVRQTIEVQMSREQARLYEDMRKHFITFINDDACTASMAVTKGLRLQQIASGYVKTEQGEEVMLAKTPREAALEELLENLTPEHKVIVWAVFRANYRQIRAVCERLGVNYVECHGEIPQKQKDESVQKFNEDKDMRVFLGHPGSGGIGVNLTAATYSIFYTRSFSLEADLQAESRNHRGGSEVHDKITRIDFICPGTIDEVVAKALANKQVVSDKLLAEMKDNL